MITVLCATRDRAHVLGKVLDNYTRLQPPEGGWEIVVVDNGSRDGTRGVIESYAGRLPIRYVFEPEPGKSCALNTGLAHVRGDLVVFTDDDILAEPGWLTAYREAADQNPDFDLFGGNEHLKWPRQPPSWAVCDDFMRGGCFCDAVPGVPSGPFDGYPIGGNFAVRASVFEAGHRFDASLGPSDDLPMGDETEFLIRMRKSGHKLWWVATAVVHHIVREDQVSKNWMLKRVIRYGRGHYRQEVLAKGYPPLVAGLPRWAIRALATQALRLAWAFVFGSSDRFFVARLYLNYYWGTLYEGYRVRPSGRAAAF